MNSSDFTKLAIPLSNTANRSILPTPSSNLPTTGWVPLKDALDTYAVLTPKLQTATVSADITLMNSTTLVDIFTTPLTIYAGKKYFFQCSIGYGNATTAGDGISVQPNITTAADINWQATGMQTGSTSLTKGFNGAVTQVDFGGGVSTTAGNNVFITGYINCTVTGTLNIKYAAETGATTGVIIRSGTTLSLQEIY